MLVLTRKNQEKIVIITPQGEEIVLKVMKINESSIKLGLEADTSYRILRGELVEPTREKQPVNRLVLAGAEGSPVHAG